MTYKIGIIGSGNIGGTLGTHFAKAGHSVFFSSRHPEELKSLVEQAGPNAQAGTVEEAGEFGEVLLLAYPFGKTPQVSKQIENAAGKVLIDANNYYPGRDGGAPGEEMKEKDLLESEWTASYYPETSVVKAFNSIAAKTLEDRAFDKESPLAVPFTANDQNGKEVIEALFDSIGFVGLYLGDLSKSKIAQPDEKLYGKHLSEAELRKLI